MDQHEGFNDEQGTRRGVEPTGVQSDAIAGQGRVTDRQVAGTTPSHDRPSFRDPVPSNMDPTDPDSPEQTLDYQKQGAADAEVARRLNTDDATQNIEEWRSEDVNRGD